MKNITLGGLQKALGQVLLTMGLTTAAMEAWLPCANADNIYVNVPTVESIAFTPSKGTSGTAIQLTPNAGLSPTSIGTVNVKSNTIGGFRVTLTSTNSGLLKRSTGETMAYTLNYNGVEKGQINSANVVMEDNTSFVKEAAGENGVDRDIKISITKSEVSAKPAGDYSDTLTFTLTNY